MSSCPIWTQAPFHAQDWLLNSSSWVGQVPNFRQEIRQSHYRNDPVKYDLADEMGTPLTNWIKHDNVIEVVIFAFLVQLEGKNLDKIYAFP